MVRLPADKLTAFADESGTVALNGFFLVASVIVPHDYTEQLAARFQELERTSDRAGRKWVRSSEDRKSKFLAGLETVLARVHPIYWRQHPRVGDLVDLTCVAVADACLRRESSAHYSATVDGFNEVERRRLRLAFRRNGLIIRGTPAGRDDTVPLLRLADALAGFLADVIKQKQYASLWWGRLRHVFQEI